jgi:hypothetical protein
MGQQDKNSGALCKSLGMDRIKPKKHHLHALRHDLRPSSACDADHSCWAGSIVVLLPKLCFHLNAITPGVGLLGIKVLVATLG